MAEHEYPKIFRKGRKSRTCTTAQQEIKLRWNGWLPDGEDPAKRGTFIPPPPAPPTAETPADPADGAPGADDAAGAPDAAPAQAETPRRRPRPTT